MPQPTTTDLYAVCAPGLEPFLRAELAGLGLLTAADATHEAETGGIALRGDLQTIYRANLYLRSASRLLLRLAEFHAAAFSELRRKAKDLPWERYLTPGQPLSMRVTCHKSRLYHSAAVARELAAAIGDRLGKKPEILPFDEEADTQIVLARLVNDECTLSIDSSGALLHRRGYRLETAKAPLRETLAAAMLLAAGWDGRSPLLDPFCGSGTIAIEAALLAANIPPGAARRFAFMHWPGFQAAHWQTLLAENQAARRHDLPPIQASDRDAGAIQISQANAERAGVGGLIEFSHRAVSAIAPPAGPGWVVTNPPYGLRVSAGHDLRNLYAQFGKVLRLHCPGWQTAILCSDLNLLRQTGLKLDTSLTWVNGGVSVRLGRGKV